MTSRLGWPKRFLYPTGTTAQRGDTAAMNGSVEEVRLP
jgi:hypothetical protein